MTVVGEAAVKYFESRKASRGAFRTLSRYSLPPPARDSLFDF